VNWWCSSSPRNWTWTPSPYLGAWIIIFAVIGLAVWWRQVGRHRDLEPDAREAAALEVGSGPYPSSSTGRKVAFVLGMIALWSVIDWPLAALGAGYLATAQMARQIIMVMVAAPLLLFATPAGLAVRLVGWGRRLTVLRFMARPLVAIPVAALSLLAVNAPALVDDLVATPYGSFGLDLIWIIAGFTLWMPVQCPHPGVKRLEGPNALTYLILQSIIPLFPGFFMTWADFPLFRTYELAPRVFEDFDAVVDQQTAAAVLQVGGMLLLWFQISFRFLNWAYQQMDKDGRKPKGGTKPIAGATAAAP
jgi:putative membrane protein